MINITKTYLLDKEKYKEYIDKLYLGNLDEYFDLDAMRGIAFDDEDFNIDWTISKDQIIVSNKDANNTKFKDIKIFNGKIC